MCQKFVIILSYVVVVPMCAVPPNQLDSAVERLSQLRAGDGTQVLDECMASIRQHMPAGDLATWRRLRAILEKAERPTQVRHEILNVAAEKADVRIALDMLDLARQWVSALSPQRSGETILLQGELAVKVGLLYHFMDLLETGPMAQHLASRPETLELLRRIATEVVMDPRKKPQAIELIHNSKASLAQRRTIAEAIVTANRSAESHHPLVLNLLDRSSFPRLRKLVKQSEDPHSFHYGAAAALAHLGDADIRGELERLVAKFTTIERNLGGILEYFLWQIEVQHPPSKLTDYIADEPEMGAERRLWAVRRSVELGVEHEKIRAAILEHAAKVEPRTHRQRTGISVQFWPGLSTLKKEAIDLGILKAEDLPYVKIATVEPTP